MLAVDVCNMLTCAAAKSQLRHIKSRRSDTMCNVDLRRALLLHAAITFLKEVASSANYDANDMSTSSANKRHEHQVGIVMCKLIYL